MSHPVPSSESCFELADTVAKACGFQSVWALQNAVITRGALVSACGDVLKAHALTSAWTTAHLCVCAAHSAPAQREAWLSDAGRTALAAYFAGRTLSALEA